MEKKMHPSKDLAVLSGRQKNSGMEVSQIAKG